MKNACGIETVQLICAG